MRKSLLTLASAVTLSVFALITPAQAIQCVPYARQVSGIDLQGDAWQWWSAAAGRYDRGRTPQTDAVMVFSRQGSMRYGHVSVVSKVVNSRMILVDHANWAPVRSAGRGAITKMVPVIDVSPKNDWSKVRVWYEPSSSFGSKVYRADGFVYNPTRRFNTPKAGLQKVALSRIVSATALAPEEHETASPSREPIRHGAGAKAKALSVAPPAKAEAPVAAPQMAAPVVAAVETKSAPASVEVNDNLGTAIAVAKASFGPRGDKPAFLFN